jgi:hypothetical protein
MRPGCAYHGSSRAPGGSRRRTSRPGGYDECLEAITHRKHERHNELLEWRGGDFDPQQFDIDQMNRRLASLATARAPAARSQSGPAAELTSGACRPYRKPAGKVPLLPARKHLDRKTQSSSSTGISTPVVDKARMFGGRSEVRQEPSSFLDRLSHMMERRKAHSTRLQICSCGRERRKTAHRSVCFRGINLLDNQFGFAPVNFL